MKNIAKSKNISAQLVMQNFMLERLLERVSLSKYRRNFLLKGGFLIAAMVGLDSRTTMDMDATIKGYPVSEDSIVDMIKEICQIDVPDDVVFTFRGIGEIREGDEYAGYRVSLTADYPPMAVPLKLDITTGDEITPREITYRFKLMLEDRYISILAYNLETVLAEKLETVISRGDQSTRPRDYYDIYILYTLQKGNISMPVLTTALRSTANKRQSTDVLTRFDDILTVIASSQIMQKRWSDYQRDFDYAKDIEFNAICAAIRKIMSQCWNIK